MTEPAGGGHADAAAARENRLAAARIRVRGIDFRIDDLERSVRCSEGRGFADEVLLRLRKKACHVGLDQRELIGELARPAPCTPSRGACR